jgi:hypothetical protein
VAVVLDHTVASLCSKTAFQQLPEKNDHNAFIRFANALSL